MEKTGDPVLDFLKKLFDTFEKHHNQKLPFPPNFTSYPDEDQHIWIRIFIIIMLLGPRCSEIYAIPPDIEVFIAGGPRPKIIG